MSASSSNSEPLPLPLNLQTPPSDLPIPHAEQADSVREIPRSRIVRTLAELTEYPLPQLTAGVDEVGRGALFGPVVAASVILTTEQEAELRNAGVTDSKALSAKRREALAVLIRDTALTWGLGWAHPREIDQVNILQATFIAMHRSLSRLVPTPEHCLVDGNKAIPQVNLPQTAVIKGDSLSMAIASASILAKVHRDHWVTCLAQRYPGYHLESNKGYGSAAHRQALQSLGPTPDHRLSFAPCQNALRHKA